MENKNTDILIVNDQRFIPIDMIADHLRVSKRHAAKVMLKNSLLIQVSPTRRYVREAAFEDWLCSMERHC